MEFKQIIFLLIFVFIYYPTIAQSKPTSHAKPYSTDLVDEIINETELGTVSLRKYSSSFSEDRIVDFYRDFFSQQGLEELYPEDKDSLVQGTPDDRFEFVGEHTRATIIFVPSVNSRVKYYVSIYDRRDLYKIGKRKKAAWSKQKRKKALKSGKTIKFFENITDPRKVDFMPIYPDVMQLEYVDWNSVGRPMISIGYLTSKDSSKVVNFYIENMPSFGWTLTKRDAHYLKNYETSEWIPMVAPYTYCAHNSCEPLLPQEIPLLSVRGETLTFKNRKEKCVITIHAFDDIVRKSKSTIYDLSVVEKYGSTAIGIAYFYRPTD